MRMIRESCINDEYGEYRKFRPILDRFHSMELITARRPVNRAATSRQVRQCGVGRLPFPCLPRFCSRPRKAQSCVLPAGEAAGTASERVFNDYFLQGDRKEFSISPRFFRLARSATFATGFAFCHFDQTGMKDGQNIHKILREEALSEQYADPIDRRIFGRRHDPIISKHQVHNCFADHP